MPIGAMTIGDLKVLMQEIFETAAGQNVSKRGSAAPKRYKDNTLRYVKQVKVRAGSYRYDSDDVIIYEIVSERGFLRFEHVGYAQEKEHLKEEDTAANTQQTINVTELRKEGKSIREIANLLGITKSKVERILKKANAYDTHQYSLEKYSGKRSCHICPNCGDRTSLVRYIDEAGNYLHDTVGRCNHESSCGYHYTPRQYYHDHPDLSSCHSEQAQRVEESPRYTRHNQPPRHGAPIGHPTLSASSP